MPVCVLSDVTTRHPESAAEIYIFEKVQWHSTKCGISHLLIVFKLALWTWSCSSMYPNIDSHNRCLYSHQRVFAGHRLLAATAGWHHPQHPASVHPHHRPHPTASDGHWECPGCGPHPGQGRGRREGSAAHSGAWPGGQG